MTTMEDRQRNRATCWTSCTFVLLAACSDTTEGTGSSTGGDPPADTTEAPAQSTESTGTTGGPTPEPTGGPSTTAMPGTTTDDSADPPVEFDVASIPDAPALADGCNAVDFLFIIDSSGSMYDKQVNLVNNFPTFSAQIQKTLENVTSYHVGVISTDAYQYNDPPCGALGDLVISTVGGIDSSEQICGPFEEGYNFMTEQDDLDASFACAAQLGTYGNGYEKPLEAMMNAISEEAQEPGMCNEGFLRDEALLVIVIITDEWDGMGDPEGFGSFSVGDPQTWYDAVVEAKDGIPQNAVVMSLINYNASPEEDPSPCIPFDQYNDGELIKQFTQMFEENGFLGGICQADYGPTFAQATEVIELACDNFVAPN
jgi:hypothetical protein